jgi:hypothetical protein
MQLQEGILDEVVVNEMTRTLFANTGVPDLPDKVDPLYYMRAREKILAGMPKFDKWGLRPLGQRGERENPLILVPVAGRAKKAAASTFAAEEAEESEREEFVDTSTGEESSGRSRRRRHTQVLSSDEEEDSVPAPSWQASAGSDESDCEPRRGEGLLAETAPGGNSSSGPGGASSQIGVKRSRWVAADE